MNVIYRVCAAAFLLLSVQAQTTVADDSLSTGAGPAAIAFVNVNVVPMDSERILPAQTVIVRGDRIHEVGPADTTGIPEDALRIDGHDQYLMPGLVDMHVHQRGEHRQFQLTLFIANGVTAVRNMAGDESVLTFREQIEAGRLVGPTIYTTGPIIDAYPPPWPGSAVVETPEQAAQVVAEHKKAGYDFIKVYNRLSLECYDAIIEAAAKYGMAVVGHVPRNVGIEHALAAGQHTAEHLYRYGDYLEIEGYDGMEKIDEEKLLHIAQATRDAGMWNCVTLVKFQKASGMTDEEADQERKLPRMRYVPPLIRERWTKLRGLEDAHSLRMSNRKRVTKALHDAGAGILLGTDTPNPYVVAGYSVHEELNNLVDAGLTPYEAIKAGTRDAAECLGELDEFGTVSAGLRADLILVEGNPLTDVNNVARRVGVMARGRWFAQSELQAMLDALAVKHATEENPDGVMLRGHWHPRTELEAMVDAQNEREKEKLAEVVLSANRVFLGASGEPEPIARAVAVKLMQAGFRTYIAGDATTPAIGKDDLFIAISDSGRTTRTYDVLSAAKHSGARVVLLTSQSVSRIGNISDQILVIDPDFDESVVPFVDELLTLISKKRESREPREGELRERKDIEKN